ncbi:hypothetical protein FB446DRAFT_329796 [Lentinula raphanica]|nr:hypothetical protein FB446DRAFT_329796 [Lentinula raphanica]
MSHLRKSKGLDYTITDDFEVSVTKVWPRPERRQQTEFFHLVLSFAGRDNNGKVWDMKSPNEAYLLTISKQCVEQRAKSTDKLQFQPKLLSGELRQIESMKLLAKFKNGMQLDLQAAATAPMPSATVKQKSSWFGMLKDKVFPTKQSQGGQSS